MGRKRKVTEPEQATTSAPEQSDTGKRKIIIPKRSAASARMREETHAWLKWPGCNNNRKIELNNKLAEIQNRPICQPRFLGEEVIDKLGIKQQLKELFVTRDEEEAEHDEEQADSETGDDESSDDAEEVEESEDE